MGIESGLAMLNTSASNAYLPFQQLKPHFDYCTQIGALHWPPISPKTAERFKETNSTRTPAQKTNGYGSIAEKCWKWKTLIVFFLATGICHWTSPSLTPQKERRTRDTSTWAIGFIISHLLGSRMVSLISICLKIRLEATCSK